MRILHTPLFLALWITAGLAAHPYPACAGGISGTVKDAGTGQPIIGASLLVKELNTGTTAGPNGEFILSGIPDGVYTFRASHVGYTARTVSVTVPGNGPINVSLSQSPVIAEEVVATARGRETIRSDITGSVETVVAEDFVERTPVSIPEALSRKPGLAVSSDMPWSQRVVVRGLMKDQVIMLVDGCRVVTATETAAEFGTVAHGDIERIEVLKGPISVLYGSGSTGGVVNVITRKGRFTDTPRVSLSLNPSFESAADGLGMYERAEWSSPRFYIGVSQANRDYSDYRASDHRTIANTQFRDRQTQVNLGFKLSPSHILEARRQDFKASDVGIPGARSFPVDAVATYPSTTRTLSNVTWTWRPSLSRWRESRLNGYYQPIHRDVELFPHTVQTAPGKRIIPESIYPGAYHRVFGARWQNVLAFGGHTVVAGIEGWRKNMESYRTKTIRVDMLDSSGNVTKTATSVVKDKPLPDSSQQPVGVFAEDEFEVGRRLKVTLGGRADIIHTENDITYKQYSPPDTTVLWKAQKDTDRSGSFVAGAIYKASRTLDLNLTLARSFRAPTIEERYLYADLGGVLTVGNPALDPEKGAFAEGGFTATLGGMKLDGRAYLNALTDMVTQKLGKFTDGRDAWVAVNAGKALLWGFEAKADWAAGANLLISCDFSLTRGADREAHVNLPFMPPPRGHLSIRRSAGGLWVEPLVTLVYRQDKIAKGEFTTPGYGIVDVTFGKTVTMGEKISHDLVLGIRNIGDKLYRDHLATSRGYDMYGPGRSVSLSLRMNYN